MKRDAPVRETLGFDDVLLAPLDTAIKPGDVSLKTRLTKSIELNIPIISAGRANVTESAMAIALARLGGLGVIHDKMPLGKQVEEVRKVKRAESGIVQNPITISPAASIAEAMDLMTTYRISGLPVVEDGTKKVVGILTGRDVRFFEDYAKPVSDLMTKEVVTVKNNVEHALARKMMHEHRIEKLVVVDAEGRCTGLITVKDYERAERNPLATRDAHGRLRVGAAVGTGKDALDRATAMADAGLDVVVVDLAQGFAREAASTVGSIRQLRAADVQVVGGNVASGDAARRLIDAGADAIKVGVGGTGCATSRKIGFGVPQLSAIMDVVEQCELGGVPVIAEGGVQDVASLAKALGAGADCVSLKGLLAGTEEAPGRTVFADGAAYKMVAAKPATSGMGVDPYALDSAAVDTSVRYTGPVANVVAHLTAGLKSAMAYAGAQDVKSFGDVAQFVKKNG